MKKVSLFFVLLAVVLVSAGAASVGAINQDLSNPRADFPDYTSELFLFKFAGVCALIALVCYLVSSRVHKSIHSVEGGNKYNSAH